MAPVLAQAWAPPLGDRREGIYQIIDLYAMSSTLIRFISLKTFASRFYEYLCKIEPNLFTLKSFIYAHI